MNGAFFEMDHAKIVVFASVIAVFILQFLLCRKVQSLLIKFLPIALLVISTVVFSVLSASANGWDGFGYLFFALLSFGLIFVCGFAWAAQAFIQKRDRF